MGEAPGSSLAEFRKAAMRERLNPGLAIGRGRPGEPRWQRGESGPPTVASLQGLLLHPWPQIGRLSFPSLSGCLWLAGLPGKLPITSHRCPTGTPRSSQHFPAGKPGLSPRIAGAAGILTSLGRLSATLGTAWCETFWTFPNMAKKRRYQAADFASKPGWIGRASLQLWTQEL